jgi:glyoxylase-like metal-dependent hydrolase (beta-lactamase superfamily II)
LIDYLETLERFRSMDPTIAYPGHGDPIEDVIGLIDGTIARHAERKKEVAALLTSRGQSPYDLAQQLFPDVTGYDVFLSVSEVVGHLDLVEADGGAKIEERDGITYYSAA